MANVQFDSGSRYSYVSMSSASDFEMLCYVLDAPIHVSIQDGESFIVSNVYCACPILFMGFQTWGDQVILDMDDFDIILGITWLTPYNDVLSFNTKSIFKKAKIRVEGV